MDVRAQGCLAVVIGMGLAIPALGAVPTVATFDVNEQGFQGSTTSTVQVYSSTGGNPGGFLTLRKDLTPPVFDIGTENMVSPEFLGDYGAYPITGGGFDLNVFNNAIDSARLRFRSAVNVNGWYYDFGPVAVNANQWESFDVSFDPTWDDGTAMAMGWTQEGGSPSWAATMGDVGWIEVRILREESTIVGVDNVRLVPTPSAAGLGLLTLIGASRRRRR